MGRLTVLALRAVIVALSAGSAAVQTVMAVVIVRRLAASGGGAGQEVAALALAILGVAALEVVLVGVWRLATMARRGTVFSPAAFRYVHLVIGAFTAAGGLLFALGWVMAPGEAVPPGIVLLVGGAGVAVLGVALIVLVLRTLLAQAVERDAEATHLRAELAEVI